MKLLSLGLLFLILIAVNVQAQAETVKTPTNQVSLSWAGDTTLGSRYGNPPQKGWSILKSMSKSLRQADISILNYEGTFGPGRSSKCGVNSNNCYAFQAPTQNASTLRRAGVDLVNLANNHSNDYGSVGLRSSKRALLKNSVKYTGGPSQITRIKIKGIKIAFVGLASYTWSGPLNDAHRRRLLIHRADRGADIVVVLFHGGAEGSNKTRVPYSTEFAFGENRGSLRSMSHQAIRSGADAVLGSGPHVLRGMEVYRGKLIAYSLGNFAGYRNFSTGGVLSLSGLLHFNLSSTGKLVSGRFKSLRLDAFNIPHLDNTKRSARLVNQLSNLDFKKSRVFISKHGQLKWNK